MSLVGIELGCFLDLKSTRSLLCCKSAGLTASPLCAAFLSWFITNQKAGLDPVHPPFCARTCAGVQQMQQEAQEKAAREQERKLAQAKKKREEDVCSRPDAGGQAALELWVRLDEGPQAMPKTHASCAGCHGVLHLAH